MIVKSKEFRDPVHGYISVPAEWCRIFIDTAVFQRLRHIEQTSMRPLYPSARHDRFTHSLGVYHLATTAFRSLCVNTDPSILGGIELSDYESTFGIAALMHDCAHACFSHTFESHYAKNGRARDFLLSLVDESFETDYEKRRTQLGLEPAPHEVFSAAVFLKHYRTDFEGLLPGGNAQLVARMITGCVYTIPTTARQQFENGLIQLINGDAIDLDKLDYVLRDTWSSGVDNVSIDVRRLLSALEVVRHNDRLEIVFRKSALSVIQSVLEGRNYLYRWIYQHHTVCYYNRLLRDAVEALNRVLSPPATPDAFLDTLFSKEVFEESVNVGGCSLYLPCDDDIHSLLKSHRNRIPAVDELLSRKASRVPLWKTEAEFEMLFSASTAKQRSILKGEVGNVLRAVLGDKLSGQVLVESVKPKMVDFDDGKIWVRLLGKVASFRDVVKKWQGAGSGKENVSFFYVYIPREAEDKIHDCVQRLVTSPVDG